MAILPLRGCVVLSRTTWDKRGPLGVHLCQKFSKSINKRLSYGSFPTERLGDSIQNHIGQKRTLWCSFLIKLIQNSSRNGWLMAISPLRVCMIPLQTTWDKREPFDVHLCQKDPKSAKKRLIYGYFPTETLYDSIENHMGQIGIHWCSFVPKRSIIRQEKAELWLLHSVNITTVPVTTLQ